MSTTTQVLSVPLLLRQTTESSISEPTINVHNEHESLGPALSISLTSTPSIESSTIDADYLLKKHQSLIDDHKSLNRNKLIEILGDPDAILKHYLSTIGQSALSAQQLHSIK